MSSTSTFSISTWQANTTYPAGAYIIDTNGNVETTIAGGTSGAIQPTWPTANGAQTVDNEMTWIEASVTRFADGTEGSASAVMAAFSQLRTQGQNAIDALVIMRENTLLLFNNAMSQMNGKKVNANRVPTIGTAVNFIVSDLLDINQPITTATLRCDANSVSLRERSSPIQAAVSTVQFAASEGTIQALQQPQTGTSTTIGALYRVATPDGSAPTGTFTIQLEEQVTTALIIFDMMDMPAGPTIEVAISPNGVSYTDAITINNNGYRWAAWFTPQEIQYVTISITPALPDTLGGTVFTFGLTDLHVFAVQYHLLSDVYTNQIEFTPQSANVEFVTEPASNITYFLSLAGNPAVEVFPGQTVTLPGASSVSTTATPTAPTGSAWQSNTAYSVTDTILDSNGNLETVTAIAGAGISGGTAPVWSIVGGNTIDNLGPDQITWKEQAYSLLTYTLPSDVYLPSLVITDAATGIALRTAPGLAYTSIRLTNQYVAIDGTSMYLVIYNQAVDQTRTFNISFDEGPSTMTTALQVELSTDDLNDTPVYNGAFLIEV